MTRTYPSFLALALAGAALAGPGAVPPKPLLTGVTHRPSFTPDGEALLVARPGAGELVLLEVATGEARDLGVGLPETARPSSTFHLSTPDGTAVVFPSEAREWAGYTCPDRDLWVAARAGGPARRLGECYVDAHRLDREAMRPGSPWVVFMGGVGEGVGLFASRYDRPERRRLDVPGHDAAKVDTWARHGADKVAFVADLEEPGLRRLYLADLGEGTLRDLTASLPAGRSVLETLSGRSDVPGDKEPLRFSPDGETLVFGVQPTGEYVGDWASLWAVDVAAGAPRELVPAGADRSTQTFSFSPDGRWICSRNFEGGIRVLVAAVGGGTYRFVVPPTVGWQWTNHPFIPPGSDRVWFWGDVETPDQETFLYSASLREDEYRRESLELPRSPDGLLESVPTLDGRGVLARGHVKGRDGFRLARIAFDGPDAVLSEDNRYGDVKQFEELADGRVAVLEALHHNLPAEFFLATPGEGRVLVSPELPPWDGVASFVLDPTGRRAALILRKKQETTRLILVDLPAR